MQRYGARPADATARSNQMGLLPGRRRMRARRKMGRTADSNALVNERKTGNVHRGDARFPFLGCRILQHYFTSRTSRPLW